MKPRFLQVHWLRRAHSFAVAGTAGTERGHCGRGGRAGGSRTPAGRGRPAAVSPTPGPEWARPRLPGGASRSQPFSCPLPVQKQPPRPPAGLQGAAAPGRRVGWAAAVQGPAGAKPPLPLPSGPCQGHLPRSPTPPPDRAESFRLRETEPPASVCRCAGWGGVPAGAGMPRAPAGPCGHTCEERRVRLLAPWAHACVGVHTCAAAYGLRT